MKIQHASTFDTISFGFYVVDNMNTKMADLLKFSILSIVILTLILKLKVTKAQDAQTDENNKYQKFYSHNESQIDIMAATKCLKNLTLEIFRERFVTILNCKITTDPGYSVMTKVIESLHRNAEELKITIETTNGTRNTFESYETCLEHCHQNNYHQKVFKRYHTTLKVAQIYLVFMNRAKEFVENIQKLQSMNSYNVSAELFVFLTKIPKVPLRTAGKILKLAYENLKYSTKLLIPMKRDIFQLYMYNLYAREAKYCASEPYLRHLSTCTNGIFNRRTYRYKYNYSRLNCTVKAVMMQIPPFIISPTEGLESKILYEVENKLNISFEKEFYNTSGSWGFKVNDTWIGLLEEIYSDPFKIGIGAVSLKEDRLLDFDYSRDYFSEKMIWVVPTSERLDEWKLIIVIFQWSTWTILVFLMIIVGILLYLTRKVIDSINSQGKIAKNTGRMLQNQEICQNEQHLRTFGSAMLLAIQVTLSIAGTQPKTITNRILFITYALFVIVVTCLYQSVLINFLTNPRYEPQISTYAQLLETTIPIGGIADFKDMFNESDPLMYKKYKVFELDDGLDYGMNLVASGKAITIGGEFYLKYREGSPAVTNKDGTSKIYMISDDNEVVFIDTFRIIFSKNFVLKNQLDSVIVHLLSCGFIRSWTNFYMTRYRPDDWVDPRIAFQDGDDGDKNEDNDIVLTLRHFEGMFLVLGVGISFAAAAFCLELICWRFEHRKKH